jgi:hypothetical protein
MRNVPRGQYQVALNTLRDAVDTLVGGHAPRPNEEWRIRERVLHAWDHHAKFVAPESLPENEGQLRAAIGAAVESLRRMADDKFADQEAAVVAGDIVGLFESVCRLHYQNIIASE